MRINPANTYFKGQFDIPKKDGREVLEGVQTISPKIQLESQTPEYVRPYWRLNTPKGSILLDMKIADYLYQCGADFTYRTDAQLALEKTTYQRPKEPLNECVD